MAWYANTPNGTLHLEGPRWIVRGKALCGRNLAKPVRTIQHIPEANGFLVKRRCKDCHKRSQTAA